MKKFLVSLLLTIGLFVNLKGQGLPSVIDTVGGVLSIQYSDSSYNYYNPCQITRIQTFTRYQNVVWVYIIEDQDVRIEKIDVSALDTPSSNSATQIANIIIGLLSRCFTGMAEESNSIILFNGWASNENTWVTNNKTWKNN